MKHKRYPRGQNPYAFIFGGIVILSILFTIVSQKSQDKLAVYTKTDKVETKNIKDESDDTPDIDTDIYTDNDHHFSLSIPTDWKEVEKSGYPTFIHSASASSIQVQVLDYDPSINNESSESASATVADDGKTFVSFDKKSTSNFELMYQDYQNSTYDYIEEVYWDRDQIIKLICTFNDENYEKIKPYYELILNSFAWKKTNEIPESCTMYYNDEFGFEVMLPASWTLGTAGSAIVATDASTGATETISMIESSSYLDSITATDMAKFLNTGQSNFMMNSYDNSKESATVKCSYVKENVQYQEQVYVYATGSALYFITFDYETGTIDETIPEMCGTSFRTFEGNVDTESTSQDNKTTPDSQQNSSAQTNADKTATTTQENVD